MASTAAISLSPRSLLGAVVGGLVAGTVDILYACGMAAMSGRSPLRVLQSIATGVLGPAAFEGGASAALVGLLCHFIITLGAAGVFLVAYARLPMLRKHFIIGFILFGVGIYAFMHGLVLPLSAIPFKMTYSPSALAQGHAVHVFLVGFPIALCVRRLSFPRSV